MPISTRYTEAEKYDQRNQALVAWMRGSSYRAIAELLSEDFPEDEPPMSPNTAYNRVKEAKEEMRPHAEWEEYVTESLAELHIMRVQCRRAVLSWVPGKNPREYLVPPCEMLLKLQNQVHGLVGVDKMLTELQELLGMSDEELESIVGGWAADMETGESGHAPREDVPGNTGGDSTSSTEGNETP